MKTVKHHLAPARWPSAEEAAQARLFLPIDVGPKRLAQRTWVPAMVPWRATEDGHVTEALLRWYGRFARGRPGALVVEATGIRDVPSGPLLRIGADRFLPGLRRLVEVVRRESEGQTKLFIQLIDFLAVKRRPDPDKFFQRFLQVRDHHRRAMAERYRDSAWHQASDAEVRDRLAGLDGAERDAILTARDREDLYFGFRERVTDLDRPHIRALPAVLPELFAEAAERAERAGFDGVELHYAHAYTMASFLSRTNDRSDGYGGDRPGRVRLPLDVYRACRSSLSASMVLGCRMLADEAIEGGSQIDDAVYYARQFAEAGIDYLSLSKGGKFDDAKQPRVGQAVYPYTGPSGHECMPTIYSDERGPLGRNLHLARQIRTAVRADGFETPIVAAGGITTFELAEGALQRGDADIIASARQSLADPDWFMKARLGRGDEVRACALTNYCEGLDQMHKQVTCRLWDRVIDADESPLMSTDGKRRLVAPPWSPLQKRPSA
ncbi:MAG: NADH:flavin oxidoreductase [Myxococcota bacterium]